MHLSACFIAFSTFAITLLFDRCFVLMLTLATCYLEHALVTVCFAVTATYGTILLGAHLVAFLLFFAGAV